MKKLKPTKKPNPYVRHIVLTFKVNHEEMSSILARSIKFTKGNLSEWIRYASMNFIPTKKDLVK
jgi:hypothetical protein